ncbi:MAG TPA: tripartite tricarboxylate transporter substrate binding protein [Burkholderiales bacterium]|nr:tripartite tricarboxylate transporter substrate binding protein [Burkholderiales bacterium]
MRGVCMLRALCLAILLVGPVIACAQPYPNRPVRLVVPFAPGGAVDIVARLVAQKMTEAYGQTVVVDNRGGAGGTIGTDLVAKAKPDGYTLLVASMGVAVNAALYPKLPYDTLKDLAPLTMLAEQPNIVVVHPSLPVKSVRELVALAKARPGEVSYASGGIGSNSHLATVLFEQKAKIRLLHVPYKGLGPAMTDLVGGQVQLIVSNVSTALPFVRSGRLRLLAVTSKKRFALLSDTPTVEEAGVPGYDSSGWYGMWAPAGMSADLVAMLNRDVTRIVASTAMRDQLAAQGLQAIPTAPEAFATELRHEIDKWARVVKASGVNAQ